MTKEYKEGYNAFGSPPRNPYPLRSPEFLEWSRGWHAAAIEHRQREKAVRVF